jgi:ATP-dependent Clp protease, protease subunit
LCFAPLSLRDSTLRIPLQPIPPSRAFDMYELNAGGMPFMPQLQRYRDYARQRQMTLADLLLENRIIFFGSSPETGGDPRITDYLANITIQKMLFLQYENKNQEIHLYINCPGGSVSATLAVYDTMQFLDCPISTYCMGLAASGAAIILAAGTKGKRFALPESKIMVHQPWGQIGGQVSDIEIQANEILKERHRLNEILAKHTGQPLEILEKETERDRYFGAQEAKAFGLVDDVLTKMSDEKKK